MKKVIAVILSAASLMGMYACMSSEKDSVATAQAENDNSSIDEDVSKFLTEATDARMMDIEEGKLAKERGTTSDVRSYGERMIIDQNKLLHEIKVLAATKNITLPASLSLEKKGGLADLKEERGDDFDKEFIKMMTIDHRRDVHAFENAKDFKDQDVRKFATQHLPIIESHLNKIKEIKKEK